MTPRGPTTPTSSPEISTHAQIPRRVTVGKGKDRRSVWVESLGRERKGKERKAKERKGKERKAKDRKRKERKTKDRKRKERKINEVRSAI